VDLVGSKKRPPNIFAEKGGGKEKRPKRSMRLEGRKKKTRSKLAIPLELGEKKQRDCPSYLLKDEKEKGRGGGEKACARWST